MDDPKLFNLRGNKKEGEKSIITKKPEDDIMVQVLNLLKNINPLEYHANKESTGDKPQFNTHYNRQPRMQNYPYTTQWKDGKPIIDPAQGTKDKGIVDPLQRNSMNMTDDVPLCIVSQSPHSPYYCAVSQSFSANQHAQNEKGEEEKSHKDVKCNMINLCDNGEEFLRRILE